METRASPFIVGLFTILVLAGVAAVVFWLGRYGDATGRDPYRVVFSDEVTGLNRGSSVLFNGIRVGDVVELSLDPEDPSKVVALITVDSKVPVRADTRAQLQFQGITGLAFLQLKAGTAESPPLGEVWDDPTQPPIIVADSSSIQDLMSGAQNLLAKLDTVAEQVSALVADNRQAVNTTVGNVETFTTALAENSESVGSFLADAAGAARRLDEVGARIGTLSEDVSQIVAAIDPETVGRFVADAGAAAGQLRQTTARLDGVAQRVDSLIADNQDSVSRSVQNLETFTTALGDNSEAITAFMADAGAAARRLNEVGARVETVVSSLNTVVEAVDPEAISRSVANVESFTTSLAGQSDAIDSFVADAGAAAGAIRQTSERLDGVAQRVDGLIADNQEAVTTSVRNLETFTTALAENSEAVGTFMADAGAAARRLNEVGGRIETLVGDLNVVVAAVDPESVRAIVADVQTFTAALGANAERISAFAENAGGAAERLNSFAGRLDGLGDDLARVVSAVDPAVVSRTVENVDAFAASLAGKSDEFETFVDDAGAVAAQLRGTSQRLDGLLARVDGMVDEEGTGSLFGDISAAAQSFRQLTENLDSRLEAITADIQRFGTGGLREFQTFMSESRQTLNNLNRVIGDLERNPSRFIFGGSDVPDYNPGRRF